MVDPIDLMLLQRFQDLGVERFGRSEVVTEGLFDDDPAPLAVTLSRKARGSKRGNRRTKETVGDREIEQSIACRARRLVQSRQMLAEPAIGLRIVEVTRQIAHPLREPLPCGLREFVEMELAIVGDEALHCVGEIRAPLRRAHVGQVDADETKFFGQLAVVCEVVECRHDEALGQVTGCAENHHRTGRCHDGARALLLAFCSAAAIWLI